MIPAFDYFAPWSRNFLQQFVWFYLYLQASVLQFNAQFAHYCNNSLQLHTVCGGEIERCVFDGIGSSACWDATKKKKRKSNQIGIGITLLDRNF